MTPHRVCGVRGGRRRVPLQDGFGWSNGVLRAVIALSSDAAREP